MSHRDKDTSFSAGVGGSPSSKSPRVVHLAFLFKHGDKTSINVVSSRWISSNISVEQSHPNILNSVNYTKNIVVWHKKIQTVKQIHRPLRCMHNKTRRSRYIYMCICGVKAKYTLPWMGLIYIFGMVFMCINI